MPIYATNKKNEVLSKKVPRNTRFDYIEPTIDTGASLSKRIKEWEEFNEDYKIAKNEIFKRIKPTSFVKLILQLAEMNSSRYVYSNENPEFKNNSLSKEKDVIEPNNNNDGGVETDRRTSLADFVKGDGELSKHVSECEKQVKNSSPLPDSVEETYNCPYLLLDVRLREDYELGHIIKAHSYPAAMLGRSVNFETPEMRMYKNKPGSIIILYDNDETAAPKAATVLVERGYNNILLLSGGIKVCWKKFPRGLIAGRIPESVRNIILSTNGITPAQKVPLRKARYSNVETESVSSANITNTNVNELSKLLSRMSSTAPSHGRTELPDEDKSVISTMTNRTSSTMRSNISRYASRRRFDKHDFEPYCDVEERRRPDLNGAEEFTMEDLAHLSMEIDSANTLVPSYAPGAGRMRTKSCGRLNSSGNKTPLRNMRMK